MQTTTDAYKRSIRAVDFIRSSRLTHISNAFSVDALVSAYLVYEFRYEFDVCWLSAPGDL